MSKHPTIGEHLEIYRTVTEERLIISREGATNTFQHVIDTSCDMFKFYAEVLVESYDLDGKSNRSHIEAVTKNFEEHFSQMKQFLKEHAK